MILPVGQRVLHRRGLRLPGGRRLAGASLFPFFDDEGRVLRLMLTRENSPDIVLLDWQPGLLLRRPFLAPLLRHGPGEGYAATGDNAPALANLWHFDPWWVLGEPRYAGHPAVPWIRHTNLPGYDRSIRHVWFDAALRRVVLLGTGEGNAAELKRFRPELLRTAKSERALAPLPDAPVAPVARIGIRGWRLNPFWERRVPFGR